MVELNRELKWQIMAEVTVEGKKKNILNRAEEKWLREKLEMEEFADLDGMALKACLLMGKKVKIENGEILLFFRNQPTGRMVPGVKITGNPKLCSILEEFVKL